MAAIAPHSLVGTQPATCLVCGGEGKARFLGLEALRKCGGCGLVWRDRPDVPSAAELYEGDFFGDAKYYASYFARSAQWRHEARLRLEWVLGFTHPQRLLEVGSGGGFFVEAATAAGIEAVGIEPARDGARYGREELRVNVLKGTFESTTPSGRFEAVCAFHVLEHVDDPVTFLAKAFSLLEPGGLLFLEVPNIEARRVRTDGADWFNLAPDHHLWHFSPSTLGQIVLRAAGGVELVAQDTIYPRYYFRSRRLLTRSGFRNALADWRCNPWPRRSHPINGDHLRLVARRV